MHVDKLSVLILLGFIFHGVSKPTTTAGSFRAYVKSVKKCEKASYPWHPNPTIFMDAEVYNTSEGNALRGFFTVTNYTTNVKIKTRSMIWQNGKWKTNSLMVNIGCQKGMMELWMSLINVKFDTKNCAFHKCRVPYNIPNTNKIHHMMTKSSEYGRILFVNEFIQMGKQFRTHFCNEYETVTEPI